MPHHQLDSLDPEQPPESGIFSDVTHDTLLEPNYERLFFLFHRLFEAHFLPLQMTILVIASTLYMWVTEGSADIHAWPGSSRCASTCERPALWKLLSTLGLYENFHRIAISLREKEMSDAGLARGMNFSHRHLRKNFIDYIMVPLVAPLYGAIPCAQAQVCHFWTLDLVYTVSKKVTRQRAKSMSAEAMA